MVPASHISPYTSLISFTIGLPTAVATYYQAWKARQESRELREGLALSSYCLEFVRRDGTSVNVTSLDSLHSLPAAGEIVLLPGIENGDGLPRHDAFRVRSLEHIYANLTGRTALTGQAHLVKIIANVDLLDAGGGAQRDAESVRDHDGSVRGGQNDHCSRDEEIAPGRVGLPR